MGFPFAESNVEEAALAWFEDTGWAVRHGPEIAPGEPAAERTDYGEVVLEARLRDALARLNPELPAEALEDAFRRVTRAQGADAVTRHRSVHRLIVEDAPIEYRTTDDLAAQAGLAEKKG